MSGGVRVPDRVRQRPDWIAVGGLSAPSKMPGYAYGLPAAECVTGGKLRAVAGSTCSHCYAHRRGNYRFDNVQSVLSRRAEAIRADLRAWTEAMVTLIPAVTTIGDPVFRWHDSGDLQGDAHFAAIVEIAERLPAVRFWIPTRELGIVGRYVRAGGIIPANLTVRISAPMVGVAAVRKAQLEAAGVRWSSVGAGVTAEGDGVCGARHNGNQCGDCRQCWDREIGNVDYPLH